MDRVQHIIPPELKDVSIEELANRRVVRYSELEPDWDAFADSQIEGRRRGQFRLIGAGGSGKPDPNALPAGGFTLSIMILPPGQGGSAHTHEVEEAFFVLEGELTVFFQDEDGKQAATTLRKYDAVSCPAGIPHGFMNEGSENVLMQTMIGAGKPGPIGFIDEEIYTEEVDRLASRTGAAAE
jgi:mannose-6-phosphate isomerase-like protein (cupin superfamily)